MVKKFRLDLDDKQEQSKEKFYCTNCNRDINKTELEKSFYVCNKCGYHFRIDSNKRVEMIFDKDSVEYIDTEMQCKNIINFPEYSEKISKHIEKLKMNSAVITGKAKIYNKPLYFGIMDYRFIMGTMGSTEGEKLTRMIEKAVDEKLPIIIFTASGGARIQEGMLAVYQMAKVAAIIKKYSNKGLLFISVLTDPTLGGVNASIASAGDIVIAEPNATVGFAGKRVIKQTINEEVVSHVQTSEFMLEHGFIDIIIERKNEKCILSNLLEIHSFNFKQLKKLDIKFQKNKSINNNLTSWQRVQIARNSKRPRFKEYIGGLISGFIELHGDKVFNDDKAMICGLGYLENLPLTIISNAKGKEIYGNMEKNFGMSHPEGYRKALRLMKQAEKFNRPILCLVDTPGAFCGIEAEERGQSKAIATCLAEMSDISVPIIVIIHGEGGSGGALAISVGDYVYMLENSFYSVISPEGAASILLKDSSKAEEISKHLKLTSNDLLEFGIVDEIIAEPEGGVQNDVELIMKHIKGIVYNKFQELLSMDKQELIKQRYMKIRYRVK